MLNYISYSLLNKNLKIDDVADYVTIDDLYHPNFTRGLSVAQATFIIMLTAVVITTTGLGIGIWKYKKSQKEDVQKGAGE